jgi:hypothetical protein
MQVRFRIYAQCLVVRKLCVLVESLLTLIFFDNFFKLTVFEATRAQLPITKLPRKNSRIAHMVMSKVELVAHYKMFILISSNQIVPRDAHVVNEVSAMQHTMVSDLRELF